jgi:hypothetical protein
MRVNPAERVLRAEIKVQPNKRRPYRTDPLLIPLKTNKLRVRVNRGQTMQANLPQQPHSVLKVRSGPVKGFFQSNLLKRPKIHRSDE